jgi:hypothetical protein
MPVVCSVQVTEPGGGFTAVDALVSEPDRAPDHASDSALDSCVGKGHQPVGLIGGGR